MLLQDTLFQFGNTLLFSLKICFAHSKSPLTSRSLSSLPRGSVNRDIFPSGHSCRSIIFAESRRRDAAA